MSKNDIKNLNKSKRRHYSLFKQTIYPNFYSEIGNLGKNINRGFSYNFIFAIINIKLSFRYAFYFIIKKKFCLSDS
jgi:hypothetical protein